MAAPKREHNYIENLQQSAHEKSRLVMDLKVSIVLGHRCPNAIDLQNLALLEVQLEEG
jgi:hypothetical protein